MVIKMWKWILRMFRRKKPQNTVEMKEFDDTTPKKDSVQTQLPVEDAGQSSLERWGVWE
jgi:hypothetical protein